jgi:ketosteroid isomerase-like protein
MPADELTRTVQELKDRAEIHDCLMTYSRAVDRLDRELLLTVYHPDAVDDHGVFVGGPNAFADWVLDMHTKTHLSHQHCQFNSTIDLDGDVAHTETYYMFVGLNREGTPLGMSGGRYVDRLEKRNGRWAIAERICVRDWAPLEEIPTDLDQSKMTAVKNLSETIKTLMRTGPQTSRDRSDPSYMRPLKVDRSRVSG